MVGNFIISTPYEILLLLSHKGDSEMGRACGTYGGQEKCIQGVWRGSVKQRLNMEGLGAVGKIILKWILNGLELSGPE